MSNRQQTIKQEVGCTGVGLHRGLPATVFIKPSPVNTGIRFARTDLPQRPIIEARLANVVNTNLATTLGKDGVTVSTVEHLLAALYGLGIDNALVELDGAEVPVMDGSAAHFTSLLKDAGIELQDEDRDLMLIRKSLSVWDQEKGISVYPDTELKITYAIGFNHPLLRHQSLSVCLNDGTFEREISKARTFGFLEDVEALRKNGYALGGSLDNAVVLDRFEILNEDGLRYPDEFVRHKVLDFIGDLALLGMPIIGRFVIHKSGHTLNHRMLRNLLASTIYWTSLRPKGRSI